MEIKEISLPSFLRNSNPKLFPELLDYPLQISSPFIPFKKDLHQRFPMMRELIQTNSIFIAMDLVCLTSLEPLSASNLAAPSTTFNLGGDPFHFFSGVVHGTHPSFAIPHLQSFT